jgi:hypothetical protein
LTRLPRRLRCRNFLRGTAQAAFPGISAQEHGQLRTNYKALIDFLDPTNAGWLHLPNPDFVPADGCPGPVPSMPARGPYANFVVTTTQDGPAFTIPPAWIINVFGQPARTYHYGVWTIMTYDNNLLDEVS